MSLSKITPILESVDGLVYDDENKRYILDPSWVNGKLNINLSSHYKGPTKQSGIKNAKEMLDRISRHFYNYIYDERSWPEDFEKKEYLVLTTEYTVKVSRDIMLSHLESVVLTRRDLLVMEHGIDLDGMKLIEDFDKNIKEYQFSLDTRRIFNRDRILKYNERLNNKVIDDLGVGY